MNAEKEEFLRHRFIPLLQQIAPGTAPLWGKLTLQQMIEHFADSVRIASGKAIYTDVITAPEHLQKVRDFVLSEKPFRENTLNPLMPQTPAPVKEASVAAAIKELQTEVGDFFSFFQQNPLTVTRNPFFGDLNFEQNVHLLHKHALHHLRQFNTTPNS